MSIHVLHKSILMKNSTIINIDRILDCVSYTSGSQITDLLPDMANDISKQFILWKKRFDKGRTYTGFRSC